MVEIPIWTGTSTFTTGSTPFGFYDADASFQADADNVADWCARRLGYPLVDIELQAGNFYACFEEAVSEYSNHVNQFNIQQNMLSIMGTPTNNNLTHQNVSTNMGGLIQLATEYGSETFTNGNINFYSASIDIKTNVQKYNLDSLIRDVYNPTASIEIKKVHHYSPPASIRFYDPYLGNQAMLDTFGFGAYSTGVSFMLMPMYADLLRVQAIEFNDLMRKSAFSFELINNELRIFPIPVKDFKLWIEYIVKEERGNPLKNQPISGSGVNNLVSDMSNAPYNLMEYGKINSVGRQWVFRYTLALVKEMLGYVRGKYGSIPIPNGETTLNAADLLSAAGTEKPALIERLRAYFNDTSKQSLLERRSLESEYRNKEIANVPMVIFVG